MQKKLTVLFTFAIFVLVMVWAITPAQAHCTLNPTHDDGHHKKNPCIEEDEGDIVRYDVTVSGDLFPKDGSLQIYEGTDGGGRSKPVNVPFQFLNLDLSFFVDEFDLRDVGEDRGTSCFAAAPVDGHNASSMTISQEKDGMAIVKYHFKGFGDDETVDNPGNVVVAGTEVGYLLEMFDGAFDNEWRPSSGVTTTATLTKWEMSINGTGGVRNIACTGEGVFTDDPGQTIEVKLKE